AAESSDMDMEAGLAAYGAYEESAPTEKAGGAETDVPGENPDKIIYSSDVTLETTDFDQTIARVEAMIKVQGGWIESSSVNGANFSDISRGYTRSRSASYTLRVPSAKFAPLMSSLSGLGNIPYSHTYTENVTAQYYDVQARLTAYKTQETRLLEMMEMAETVEDIVILEDRLTELRYQIESLQSTLNNWDRRVSYSTIYLEIREVREYTPEPEVQLSYGQELAQALRSGGKSAVRFFRELSLWLAESLPFLLMLAVVLAILIPILKKRRGPAKERREARKAARAAKKAEKKAAKAPSTEPPEVPKD
ncbi:MAG: DUF4349 domain-containing protein, partial [Oscillospiraceae bacterium]|nr:DUF4349 domain-containing protein [Oscillospiraceae bacterium]